MYVVGEFAVEIVDDRSNVTLFLGPRDLGCLLPLRLGLAADCGGLGEEGRELVALMVEVGDCEVFVLRVFEFGVSVVFVLLE